MKHIKFLALSMMVLGSVACTEKVNPDDFEDPTPTPVAGWSNVSENYSLPTHIQIFKNTTLGANKVTGFAAVVSPKATIAIYGDGLDANHKGTYLKKLSEVVKTDGKNDIVVVPGLAGYVQNIHFGEVSYARENAFPVIAKENGKFFMAGQKVAAKGSTDLIRTDLTGNTIKENWKPDFSFGGYYPIVKDGKAMDASAMSKIGNYSDNWWKGDACDARMAIGVDKSGKMVIFVNQPLEDGTQGISMKELQEVLIGFNVVDGMTMEGSGSPDMRVKGEFTVHNKKLFKNGQPVGHENDAKPYEAAMGIK